jgi:endonuclease/exonuclease/phosphatase family metal-dependent hydrolase
MVEFSLLTFNSFGAPAPMTRRRLLALATELNRRAYSIVCIQEAQTNAYCRLLTESCIQYPSYVFEPFYHAPKGGLLTLAQLPIEQREFTLYRAREIVSPLAVMDLLLHKGVLRTIASVAGVPIIVLNTHLSANYSINWSPSNRYARIEHRQLQQLAEIVRAQPADALVIAAGDFNIPRGSWLYQEFLDQAGMVDPLAGDTRPTHRMPPGVPARLAQPIDFTLIRLPPLLGLTIQSDLCLNTPQLIAGARHGFLSDHAGVELQITWDSAPV